MNAHDAHDEFSDLPPVIIRRRDFGKVTAPFAKFVPGRHDISDLSEHLNAKDLVCEDCAKSSEIRRLVTTSSYQFGISESIMAQHTLTKDEQETVLMLETRAEKNFREAVRAMNTRHGYGIRSLFRTSEF